MITFDHIKGGTLELHWKLTDQGNPVDMTGWTVSAELYERDYTYIDNFAVAVTDAEAGEFTLSFSAAGQADWPIGDLKGKLLLTRDDGKVFPSEQFRLRVHR
jgi:hypothetical protein